MTRKTAVVLAVILLALLLVGVAGLAEARPVDGYPFLTGTPERNYMPIPTKTPGFSYMPVPSKTPGFNYLPISTPYDTATEQAAAMTAEAPTPVASGSR